MATQKEYAEEFRSIRHQWIKKILPFIGMFLGGLVFMGVADHVFSGFGRRVLQVILFATSFAGVVGWTFATLKYYRCPSCGKVPTNWSYDVLLTPKVCPHCKVALSG